MKRILTVLFAFLLGVVVGAAGWYLLSPVFIDNVVAEELTTGTQVVASGTFRDADAVHQGSGEAAVVLLANGSHEVQFSNFEVTNGPDLEVWLSVHPDPASSSDVTGGEYLSLGQLKGNIGNQAYAVPAGTDITAYRSVVIWCEQFGVLFSPAALN